MRGGVLNKARRGELEMGPPVGLVYLPDGSIGLDPDQEVRAAIRMVFDTFERTGSAMQTVRFFRERGASVPAPYSWGRQKGGTALGPSRSIVESYRYCTTHVMLAPSFTAAHAAAASRMASTPP